MDSALSNYAKSIKTQPSKTSLATYNTSKRMSQMDLLNILSGEEAVERTNQIEKCNSKLSAGINNLKQNLEQGKEL